MRVSIIVALLALIGLTSIAGSAASPGKTINEQAAADKAKREARLAKFRRVSAIQQRPRAHVQLSAFFPPGRAARSSKRL